MRAFLSASRCAVLSTIGTDGAPRQIVIHYLLGDDHLRINGHRDRRWVANLQRDPRASLIVHDQADYLHYVSIRGTATFLDAGDAAVGEAMIQAERYGEEPAEFAGQPRVSFRIEIERLTEYLTETVPLRSRCCYRKDESTAPRVRWGCRSRRTGRPGRARTVKLSAELVTQRDSAHAVALRLGDVRALLHARHRVVPQS
ncbi:MAG: TIGR03618 family F420-dependent PPOX class oxidoreductase [Solirubrobacteraceae bacterium]